MVFFSSFDVSTIHVRTTEDGSKRSTGTRVLVCRNKIGYGSNRSLNRFQPNWNENLIR